MCVEGKSALVNMCSFVDHRFLGETLCKGAFPQILKERVSGEDTWACLLPCGHVTHIKGAWEGHCARHQESEKGLLNCNFPVLTAAT